MSTEKIDVRYVADLARIELTDAEAAEFQSQLGEVLDYVGKLQEVDLGEVEKRIAATEIENNLREDEPAEPLGSEKVLRNAPQSGEDLVVVPKIIE
ncbi:MAG: Asp-tRNA(Asn)/Glu-tRNA(Gln) amidotransferase subunit GatC [Verrucomicrobiota bacterium]